MDDIPDQKSEEEVMGDEVCLHDILFWGFVILRFVLLVETLVVWTGK